MRRRVAQLSWRTWPIVLLTGCLLGACGGGSGGGGVSTPAPATSPIGFLAERTTLLPGGYTPFHLATGFFDGDAYPDVAAAHYLDEGVSILLGRGDGTFEPIAPITTGLPGLYSAIVRAASLDLDPFVDLVVVDNVESTVQIYLGRGDGTFDPVSAVPLDVANSGMWDVGVGRLDGDVLDDVVFVTDTGVHVYLATGFGGLSEAAGSPYLPASQLRSLHVAHADTVPGLDLVVCSSPTNLVHILRGDDNGGFAVSPMSPVATPETPISAVVASIDGLGGPDLVVQLLPGFRLYLGTGDTTFTPTAQGLGGVVGEGGVTAVVIPRPSPPGFPAPQHDDVVLLSLTIGAGHRVHLTRLRPLDDNSGFVVRTSQTTENQLAFHLFVLDADQDGELDLLLPLLEPAGFLEVRLGG
jgi:hypothetical protein